MTVFWRYWLLQIPGWLLLALLLVAANRWLGLPGSAIAVVAAAWLVKDIVLYPFLKPHYAVRTRSATSRLVGERAVAQEAIDPRGYVKLGGELWSAEIVAGSEAVAPEETVTVEAVDGLTLRVRR